MSDAWHRLFQVGSSELYRPIAREVWYVHELHLGLCDALGWFYLFLRIGIMQNCMLSIDRPLLNRNEVVFFRKNLSNTLPTYRVLICP